MKIMNQWPKRIPRGRAIPAMELSSLILDKEDDPEPHYEPGDNYDTVTIDAESWRQWVELARAAVGDTEGTPS